MKELQRRALAIAELLSRLRELCFNLEGEMQKATNEESLNLAAWILTERVRDASAIEMKFIARCCILNTLAEILKYNGCYSNKRSDFQDAIKKLLLMTRKGNVEATLGIVVQATPFTGTIGEDVRYRIYSNLHSLSPRTIFFAVINGIVSVDKRVIDHLEMLVRKTSPRQAEQLVLGNPVYVLILLHTYGYLNEFVTSSISHSNYPMLHLITEPEKFFFSGFKAHWWPLLNITRVQNVLMDNHRKMNIVRIKLEEYLQICNKEERQGVNRILQKSWRIADYYI
ncbi:MAG: hypothetical protein K5989_00610 [Lachnospiraceae bacterium]|nr:hypothetical protein [Lachnospiraceae bacterium]